MEGLYGSGRFSPDVVELGRLLLCKPSEEERDEDRAYMGPIRFVRCLSRVDIVLEDDGVEKLELRGM